MSRSTFLGGGDWALYVVSYTEHIRIPIKKKTRKNGISPKVSATRPCCYSIFLRNGNRLKHSADRDNFQAEIKGTWTAEASRKI